MKYCPRCKTKKERSEFYKDKTRSDGVAGICKECSKKNYQKRKEKHRQYYYEYYRTPEKRGRIKQVQQAYNSRPDVIAKRKDFIKSRKPLKSTDPEKYEAYRIMHNAINSGDLIKEPCEVCGATKQIEAHHEDYTKPLDVNWLCITHHRALHVKKNGNEL